MNKLKEMVKMSEETYEILKDIKDNCILLDKVSLRTMLFSAWMTGRESIASDRTFSEWFEENYERGNNAKER